MYLFTFYLRQAKYDTKLTVFRSNGKILSHKTLPHLPIYEILSYLNLLRYQYIVTDGTYPNAVYKIDSGSIWQTNIQNE